jgi:hypothetical protein
MMSAAISMIAGVEQTKVRPLSGDLSSGQGDLEDFSFAKSFNERVEVATSSQGKNAADDLAIALPRLKGTTFTKKLEGVAERSSGVKEESITAQEIPVHSELKGAVADKIIQPQATTVAGSQEKTTEDDAGTREVELPAQVKGTAADVSTIPYVTPAPGVADESLGPHVGIADGDRPLVPLVLSGDSPVIQGDSSVVQKGTEAAEKVMAGVSSKKTAKTQESSATQKTVQKTVGKIVDAIAVEPKPVIGVLTESAIPVVGQVAPTVALQDEISKATAAFSDAVSSVTKPSTGISPIAVDGQVHKEIASGAKASVTDTAMMVIAGSDPVASPKTDMSQEKMPAVAIPRGNDGENKPQTARESGTALLHSVGIVPTAVVSGNTPELAATKLPVGDAGAHTAGLSAGSREQDGAGVGAQSMDGAPRTLASTPTSLEVGIQNGTHGWLKVRAEMTDGGVVNASVSAASPAGQEMLHRELPALTAYLQEEKVAVNSVIVHAGTDARSSSGTDGAGGQTPQRSNGGEEQHQNLKKATVNGSGETTTYRSLHGVDEDGSLPLAAYASGGSWLSVRA